MVKFSTSQLSLTLMVTGLSLLFSVANHREIMKNPLNAIARDNIVETNLFYGLVGLIPYGILGYSAIKNDAEQARLYSQISSLTATNQSLEARQTREIQQAYQSIQDSKNYLNEQEKKLKDFRLKIEIENVELQDKRVKLDYEKSVLDKRTKEISTKEKSLLEDFERLKTQYNDLIQKKVNEYIQANSDKLALEAQKRIQDILTQESELKTKLEDFKTKVREQVKQEFRDAYTKLKHDREKLRIDIENSKLQTKKTLDYETRRIKEELTTLNTEKALISDWLKKLLELSKRDKEQSKNSVFRLYEKYKSMLFESFNGEIKPVHLRIIAGTIGGKSTLIQNLLTMLTCEIQGLEIIIADGAGINSQSDWGKLKVDYFGHDESLQGLKDVHDEYEKRCNADVIRKNPLLLVIDEADQTLRNQPEYGDMLATLLRSGRHQNIYVWLICQSKNIKHLGLDDSDRTNYSTLVLGNALINFLNGDTSVLSPTQRNEMLKYFESLIEKNPRNAVFYCLIKSQHCLKPELVETPKPKAFESILTDEQELTRTNGNKPPSNQSQTTMNSTQTTGLNQDEQKRITSLLQEFNGSLDSDFDSWGKLAQEVIGKPSKSKTYRAKKMFLVSKLKELGHTHLLPKEAKV